MTKLVLEYRLPKSRLKSSPSVPFPSLIRCCFYLIVCLQVGGKAADSFSGSVWALFFHPLIKSCTFLIGEQNLQTREKNPSFRSIQGLKFIWLWNVPQGLTALLRQLLKAGDTLIWKCEERAQSRGTRSQAAKTVSPVFPRWGQLRGHSGPGAWSWCLQMSIQW